MVTNSEVLNALSKFVTLELLFSRVTDLEIFQYFIAKETGCSIQPGGVCKSPFRKDTNPSFGIFQSDRALENKEIPVSLFFKDFRLNISGDCIQFISKLYGIHRNECATFIAKEMDLDVLTTESIHSNESSTFNKRIELTKLNKTIVTDSVPLDTVFWDNISVGKDTLNFYGTTQVSNYDYYINNQFIDNFNVPSPTYKYLTSKGVQLYSPKLNRSRKFRTFGGGHFGYNQLPAKGHSVIIDKSCKDVHVCHELGYPSICALGEGNLLDDYIIKDLFFRFDRVYLMLDNDLVGKECTSKYLSKYPFLIPKFLPEYLAKDKSELIEFVGKYKSKSILENLLIN